MTISGGSALSKEDIDRMVKEAEQYAEEDAKRRESVEVRNQADQLVYTDPRSSWPTTATRSRTTSRPR